jgi:hypothetical protein
MPRAVKVAPMVIVGSALAVTAIAVFFAWAFIQKFRALWCERRATKLQAGSGAQEQSQTPS